MPATEIATGLQWLAVLMIFGPILFGIIRLSERSERGDQ